MSNDTRTPAERAFPDAARIDAKRRAIQAFDALDATEEKFPGLVDESAKHLLALEAAKKARRGQ